MATTFGMLTLETIAQLRDAPINEGQVVLVLGAVTYGDGLGGFYRWVATNTSSEEATPYFNVIKSDLGATGRWVRTFQRVRIVGPNILVINGGFKTVFAPATTDANGRVTVYLTDDGTAAGVGLFSTVMMTTGEGTTPQIDANNIIFGGRYSMSADMRTLTYQFARGNSATVSLLGVNILGMRAAATGTNVVVRVDGM